MRLNNLQDLLAGLLFVAFGVAALYFGQPYAIGSATRMGPGYLPNVLGWMLVGIGTFIAGKSFLARAEAMPRKDMQRVLLLLAWLIVAGLSIWQWPHMSLDQTLGGDPRGILLAVAFVVVTGLTALLARPQFAIIAALIAFALTIERLGLLVAAAAVVALGSLASREVRPMEMTIVAVVSAVAAVGLFIYLLGQPMAPWNWGF